MISDKLCRTTFKTYERYLHNYFNQNVYMIIEKLLLIELETENNINKEFKKMEAIRTIKKLFNKIDFSVELVPIEDEKRLIKILSSLKGKQLNKYEIKLVEEIVGVG